MKCVLIIGADFVPSSLPPATRIRFFATHLEDFGWHPIVLTVSPEFYESTSDIENQQLLPEDLEVIRTSALHASWTRRLGFGDVGLRSLWHHWQALKKLCKNGQVDLIFIPVPPYVPMILGRLAHMRFGIPYVIDYIDPWVTEYYWSLPRKQRPPKWVLADTLSRCLEPFALARAKKITGVSQGTTDQVKSRYLWLTAKATAIPYGAEASDFNYMRNNPRRNTIFSANDGRFHLCYVGAYVESMEKTLRAFFAAIKTGLIRDPSLFGKLVVHFVGTTYATNGSDPFRVTRIARDCEVDELVNEHPERIPYLDSLQLMLDAAALLLLGSEQTHYTASKVFPSVLSGRPLLAVFHRDSSVSSILGEVGAGRLVTFNEVKPVDSCVREISVELEHLLRLEDESCVNWEAFKPYTTRAMTALLAHSFDEAVQEV